MFRTLLESTLEFTDRYKAAGMPYPDLKTVCTGPCEGMGVVPVSRKYATDPGLIAAWDKAQRETPSEDGWHFVECPDCKGTGKRL